MATYEDYLLEEVNKKKNAKIDIESENLSKKYADKWNETYNFHYTPIPIKENIPTPEPYIPKNYYDKPITMPNTSDYFTMQQNFQKQPALPTAPTALPASNANSAYLQNLKDELMKKPELKEMAPAYRDYITNVLSDIDKRTAETVKTTSGRLARYGTSPYAQRELNAIIERGGQLKATEGARLTGEDLLRRQQEQQGLESERRGFLKQEVGTQQQISTDERNRLWNLQDMAQQRGYNLQDLYTNREWQLTDEQRRLKIELDNIARQRGWNIADMLQGREWQTADRLQGREWELQDWEKNKQLAEDLAKRTASEKGEWWQSILTGIAGAAGTALGGPIGGAIGTGIANMFSGSNNSSGTSQGITDLFNKNYNRGSSKLNLY